MAKIKRKGIPQEDTSSNQHETNAVITVVLTADNHLGRTAFGQQPRKREEQLQRLRVSFQQAVDFAIGQGVDLFIQAGNLFDRPNPHEQDRSFVAGCLARLAQADIAAFALGGVDDTPANAGAQSAPQASYAQLDALHYFDPAKSELEPTFLDIRGMRVGVCGLGIRAGQSGDLLARLHISDELKQAAISLLILHAPIEGLPSGGATQLSRAVVKRNSIKKQTIFRTILAGYHPAFQRLHSGECDVVVAGATLYMDFNQAGEEPGFVFLGLDANGIRWCKHMAVDAMKKRQLVIQTSEFRSTAASEEGALEHSSTATVLEQLRLLCSEDAIVQLRLEGELTRDQYHQLDLSKIRVYGEEHCFAFAIDESGLVILSAATPARGAGATNAASSAESELGQRQDDHLSLRQEVIALADEWIETVEDEQEKQALRATKEELLAAIDRIRL